MSSVPEKIILDTNIILSVMSNLASKSNHIGARFVECLNDNIDKTFLPDAVLGELKGILKYKEEMADLEKIPESKSFLIKLEYTTDQFAKNPHQPLYNIQSEKLEKNTKFLCDCYLKLSRKEQDEWLVHSIEKKKIEISNEENLTAREIIQDDKLRQKILDARLKDMSKHTTKDIGMHNDLLIISTAMILSKVYKVLLISNDLDLLIIARFVQKPNLQILSSKDSLRHIDTTIQEMTKYVADSKMDIHDTEWQKRRDEDAYPD